MEEIITKTLEKSSSQFPKKLLDHVKDCKKIYFRGDLGLLDKPAIAVVGSRNCTNYGIGVAKAIGERCAKYDVALVSGLAKGIDTAAHKGCLNYGGKTIAVLGNGANVYYPRENIRIQKEIERNGLVLSEYEDDFVGRNYTFPKRNRLISGLAEIVVVVEAGLRSGSLITAELAVDQGKVLYAIPGNITNTRSYGTNKLIYDGVTPLLSVEELFKNIEKGKQAKDVIKHLTEEERKILEVLESDREMTIEELYIRTGIKPHFIASVLTVMEMKGLISSDMGTVMKNL